MNDFTKQPIKKSKASQLHENFEWHTHGSAQNICSPKFRAVLISGCGLSKPIPRRQNKNMDTPICKFAAIVQTPVYPKTLHQFRPPKAAESPKPPKRGNIFSKSRDVREDRGTREMKTTQNAQSFPRGR
jgi:hypothetical protein